MDKCTGLEASDGLLPTVLEHPQSLAIGVFRLFEVHQQDALEAIVDG